MKKERSIVMKLSDGGLNIFGIVAASLTFGGFYLSVVSAMGGTGRLLAVLPGMAVVALYYIFSQKSYAKLAIAGGVLVYSLLCAVINIGGFLTGVMGFWKDMAYTANLNMHWGLPTAEVLSNGVADFLFTSVLSVWLAFVSAATMHDKAFVYIIVAIFFGLVWTCLGLFPKLYAVLLFIVAATCLLIFENDYPVKSTVSCLLGIAVMFGAIAPCFIYSDNGRVKGVRTSIAYSADKLFYGKDTLPEGNLKNAYKLHSSREQRLEVIMDDEVANLYLKGFVGSELIDNVWEETDKNAYVQNDFQGLLAFLAPAGLPVTQYSKYCELCGMFDNHKVLIKNVGANRKYNYMPYALTEYSGGSAYYDINLRSSVFASKQYEYTVRCGDRSSESMQNSPWLYTAALQTPAMVEYLNHENEYRAFVGETYRTISERDKQLIKDTIDIGEVNITTVAQMTGLLFKNERLYMDIDSKDCTVKVPDKITGSFIEDFFGGKIRYANSIYFATAATYAFRAYGYAARYVEGYLALSSQAEANRISVTSRNAHAWTEVYFAGMGWLPIDLSPTFFNYVANETPTDPVKPDTPVEPIEPLPDDEPIIEPDDPEINPAKPLTPEEKKVLSAMQVLLPISVVLAVIVFAALGLAVRRIVIIGRKNKQLDTNGEAFGRAAFSIAEGDSKHFGGFVKENMSRLGITERETARFVQLVEQCVYGGYDLSVNEKNIVRNFLSDMAHSLTYGHGKFNEFKCKYIYCLGL